LDGIKIYKPTSVSPSFSYVELEERTANGRLVVERVGEKKNPTFNWGLIPANELEKILNILSTGVFHELTYPDPRGGERHTIMAKLTGELTISSWRVIAGRRWWQNVSMTYIER